MNILDLHGQKHSVVEDMVESFILMNPLPLKIITGKSEMMISIMVRIVQKHNLGHYPENFINYGAYIIHEKTQ